MENIVIKIIKELATNPLRKDALDIVEAGYQAVLTENILTESVFLDKEILKIKDQKYDLKKFKKIYLVAFGKCANQSALVLEKVLEDRISEGIVLDITSAKFNKLQSEKGTHPLPSKQNIKATQNIINLLNKVKKMI